MNGNQYVCIEMLQDGSSRAHQLRRVKVQKVPAWLEKRVVNVKLTSTFPLNLWRLVRCRSYAAAKGESLCLMLGTNLQGHELGIKVCY
jgi:hypothetical protein